MSIIINPGSGPVRGATIENARANMRTLLDDVRERFNCGAEMVFGLADEGDGRWSCTIRVDGRTKHEVEMPGLPLEQVRWVDDPDQNIWDFPRLYIDGSSWVWKYAIEACDPEDDES